MTYRKNIEKIAVVVYSLLVIVITILNRNILLSTLLGALIGYVNFRLQLASVARMTGKSTLLVAISSYYLRLALIVGFLFLAFFCRPVLDPLFVALPIFIFNILLLISKVTGK